MKQITFSQARINLSKIADRVKRTGQSVTLTKRGEPYVDLVPHNHSQPPVTDPSSCRPGETPKGIAQE